MEENDKSRLRTQYYLVTQKDCDALRDIQLMIVAMMPPPAYEQDDEHHRTPLAPGHTDTRQLLADIRAKIGRVLDSICLHNIQRAR
jgi:hypothetical protein